MPKRSNSLVIRDFIGCVFVNYENVFARMQWHNISKALKIQRIDWRDRRLVRNFYMEQTAKTRIGSDTSEPG